MDTNGKRVGLPRRWVGAAGLVGAGLLAGGILAGSQIAGAATSSSKGTVVSSSSGSSQAGAPMDPAKMTHGPGESLLTGATASKVTAAAKAAVPGATIVRVETESSGAAYEAHMQKADGSYVTVKLDSAFKVTSIDAGFGGPGPRSGSGSSSDDSGTGA